MSLTLVLFRFDYRSLIMRLSFDQPITQAEDL